MSSATEQNSPVYLPHIKRLRSHRAAGLETMESAIEVAPPEVLGAQVFCLSLVGGSSRFVTNACDRLNALKLTLEP